MHRQFAYTYPNNLQTHMYGTCFYRPSASSTNMCSGTIFRHRLKPNHFSDKIQTDRFQPLKTSGHQNQDRRPELSYPKQSVRTFEIIGVSNRNTQNELHHNILLVFERTEAQ